MVNPPEYKDILDKIRKLPEKWDENSKKMELEIIAHPDDAGWISKRIYKEVDKGIITSNIRAHKSEYSVEMHIILTLTSNVNFDDVTRTLNTVAGTVDKAAQVITDVTALLLSIKFFVGHKWSERKKKKRVKN